MKRKHLFAAMVFAATPLAQAATEMLDEVVVTASRSEQPLSQTLQHTSVIRREDIIASGATDVLTLLRNLAGVQVSQSGGIGSQSSLFLRGTNSTHTLILLDGVRIGSATSGATALDQLMLDQVERIEVVRGNVSSLYGSEAIGGVIQIFTRRGAGGVTASAGYGSHHTRHASASVSGEFQDATFHLGFSRLATDGISAIDPALEILASPDADGYDNTSLSARADYAFNADHRLEASVFRSLGTVQTDNPWGSPTDEDESGAVLSKWSVAMKSRLLDGWDSRLMLAQGTDDLVSRSNGIQSSAFRTVSDQVSWQNTLAVGEQVVLLGAERLRQEVSSDTAFTAGSRTTDSLLAGYSADYGGYQLQANLRQDQYSDFGAANTGLLGYGWRTSDEWRLTASAATAFKAPTFNDMYYPLSWGYQGNPNLKPERSRNLELGAHHRTGGAHLDAILFQNRIRDLIVVNSTYTTVDNLDEAIIEGMELACGIRHEALEVENALTLQSPRNARTGAVLPRRAKTLNTLTVTRHFDEGRMGLEWRSSGARNDGFNTLAAYDVINYSVYWRFVPHLELNARIDNLFDRNDTSAYGYNPPGRTVWFGVSYR